MKIQSSILKSVLLLLFYILVYNSLAQKLDEKKPKNLIKIARQAILEGDLYTGIEYFEKYLSVKPNDKKIKSSLALLYTQSKLYQKALGVYEKLLKEEKGNNTWLFYYAFNLQKLGLYDSSLMVLKKCHSKELPADLKPKYKLLFESCLFAKTNDLSQPGVLIYHQDSLINSLQADFSPYFINDSLIIYTTGDTLSLNLVKLPENQSVFSTSLYFAKRLDSITWVKTSKLTPAITQTNRFVCNGTLSTDGKRFYFTICEKNWLNKIACGIYVSKLDGKNWDEAVPVSSEVTDLNYTNTQPAIGTTYDPNIETLYFSSDRNGGFGGLDIWYLTYNKKLNKYGAPQNVGSKINTTQDEVSPFYNYESRTLYFSSNGRIGYGGFDVFSSIGELKNWMRPENIGKPVNSSTDDLYYSLNQKQNNAFIVSNRSESYWIYDKYCCYDLFYVQYLNPTKVKISGTLQTRMDPAFKKYLSKGIELSDSAEGSDSNIALDKAVVAVYMVNDQLSDSVFIHSDTTDEKGRYTFMVPRNHEYSLIYQNKDEKVAEIRVSTKALPDDENAEVLVPEMKVLVLPEKPIIVKNIYYEFNKSNLSDEGKRILDSTLICLLSEMPNLVVQISSHTDNIGDEKYNVELSQKRAENVLQYIVSKGISKNRLIAVGYGESIPIVSNTNLGGSDNPQGREKNRRTEFKIIKH